MVLYLIKTTHSTRPNTSLRRKLAENIVEQLWTNMAINNKAVLKNAFYTPSFMSTYVKDGKVFKKSHEPCGYIQAKLKNMWAAEKRPRLSTIVAIENPAQQTQMDELTDTEYSTVKTWLQNNTAPLSIVLQKLTVSFTIRRKEIEKMDLGVAVQEWPILVEMAEAVIHEFSLLYPDKNDVFYQRWPTVSINVLNYLHKTKITMLSCGITVNEFSNDQKMGAALYVLPFILKNKTNRGNLASRPEDFFIEFVKPQTNMEEFSKTETIRSQPFVILKGYKTSFEIQESFVMIERRLIKCQSLMQAIDVCLKIYYIFSLKFPKECQWTWSFISEAIYGLKAEKRMIPTVSQFTAEVIVGDIY